MRANAVASAAIASAAATATSAHRLRGAARASVGAGGAPGRGTTSESSWRRIARWSPERRPRLDPELVDQLGPRATVGLERVGLAARAVQREHLLPRGSARGMDSSPRASPARGRAPHDGRARARRRSGPRSHRAELLQSARASRANGSEPNSANGSPRQSSSASPSRSAAQPRPRKRAADGRRQPAARTCRGRARRPRPGARSRPSESRSGRPQRLRPLRDVALERLGGRVRRGLAPELLDEHRRTDRAVSVQQQHREQRARLGGRQRDGTSNT